jgi:hypothetical protein
MTQRRRCGCDCCNCCTCFTVPYVHLFMYMCMVVVVLLEYGRHVATEALALLLAALLHCCVLRLGLQCKTRLETHFKNVDSVIGYYRDCLCEVSMAASQRASRDVEHSFPWIRASLSTPLNGHTPARVHLLANSPPLLPTSMLRGLYPLTLMHVTGDSFQQHACTSRTICYCCCCHGLA